MRFAVPHALLPSVAKMPPCAISGAHFVLLIQYWWSSYRSLQLSASQQNMELQGAGSAAMRSQSMPPHAPFKKHKPHVAALAAAGRHEVRRRAAVVAHRLRQRARGTVSAPSQGGKWAGACGEP